MDECAQRRDRRRGIDANTATRPQFPLEPRVAQQRTLERKLRESVLALKLTASYPKDEILALYLNQTY